MACVPLPEPPPLPALPPGISITPTIPAPNLSADLCCKIPILPAIPAVLPLPPAVLNPAVAAVIETILAGVSAYRDALAIPCPRE